MATRALDVWMNGELVGVWQAERGGTQVFQYEPSWLDSPRTRPLSLSLPIVPGNQPYRGDIVAAWFDNLLPDSRHIRERISRRFGTGSLQAFDLLAAIGRDCVGAVQLVPHGSEPGEIRTIESEALNEAAVAKLLRGVTSARSLGLAEDAEEFRISIAGAQEKTALLRLNGAWHLPRAATPTTHILKLPLGLIAALQFNMHESVENEWLCMHFLEELGLPVAKTDIAVFSDEIGEKKALVVERFDREWVLSAGGTPGWILRLPQEDFCQAKGIPADRKYESDGGPGIAAGLELLAGGDAAGQDKLVFAKTQLAFWLLAATDGHAKNFSIFLTRNGYRMTPLYDVLSAWPIIGDGPNQLAYQKATLAMAVRGSKPYRHLGRIPVRQWPRLAALTAVPTALDEMVQLAEGAEAALGRIESALPPRFPEHVWTPIRDGVRRHRERFLQMLPEIAESGEAK